VQRRQFEEGLPLKQLRQIQRRHFEEGAVSSLSGKGDSNHAKAGQADGVTACAPCAVLGLGCPNTVEKCTSPEWGSEGTSPGRWQTVSVCSLKTYMCIALTRNILCRPGQRRLCLIRSPERERESYFCKESDNVKCLF